MLKENNRLDNTNQNSVVFNQFLDKFRDGENTEEDWNTLREKCSFLAIGIDEWENKGFDDEDATQLHFTNKKFNDRSSEMIQKLEILSH